MTAWVALLRAVNVAGRNQIPMMQMRSLMADLGHPEALTHLQGGNACFRSDLAGPVLGAKIRDAVAERFGHDIEVIMRDRDDLAYLVASVPWEYPANSSSGVVFMTAAVDPELALEASAFAPDRLVVDGADVHVDIPTGFGATKLTVAWIEKQTGLAGTRRNWKTVKALANKLEALG